jgi:hypothetical protein
VRFDEWMQRHGKLASCTVHRFIGCNSYNYTTYYLIMAYIKAYIMAHITRHSIHFIAHFLVRLNILEESIGETSFGQIVKRYSFVRMKQ